MKKSIFFSLFLFVIIPQEALSQCGAPPTIDFNQNTFSICPGDSAHIMATPNGTVGSYSLQWSPGGIADTSLNYTVAPSTQTWFYLELTDDCFTVVDSVNVEPATPANITNISVTNATNCPGLGGSLGSIDITPNDPLWTYTVIGGGTVSGPQNNGTFTNLAGGITYFLNVISVDGCQLDTAVTVNLGANPVNATFVMDSLRDVSCFGDADGGAYIENINGGSTPPFDVTWTHTSGLYATETVSSGGNSEQDVLYGGQWVVSITDQQDCAWSYYFEIDEPVELIMSPIFNSPTCYLFNDGSLSVNATGGNGTNDFSITDSQGTQLTFSNTANQLTSGWYYYSVTDIKGCFSSDSIFIDQPGELDIDYTTEPYLCSYDSTWLRVDTVYNFTGDYNQIGYYWFPNPAGIGGIGADSSYNMTSDNYSLTINDENGCSKVFDLMLTAPQALSFSQLGFTPCTGSNDGSVSVAATGGTPSYTYQWTNLSTLDVSNNTTWGNLGPGNYQILVTDANGCELSDTVILGCLGIGEQGSMGRINIYPNPSSGLINIETELDELLIDAEIFDLGGKRIHYKNINQSGSTTLYLENMDPGVYSLKIWTDKGVYAYPIMIK